MRTSNPTRAVELNDINLAALCLQNLHRNCFRSGVALCVLPQQVNKEDGAGQQEEDSVEEEGDDHPGES